MGRDSGHAHDGTVTEHDRRYGTSASLVASDIGENIISGHLPPGSSLRVHELASQYEMSLTPVREAMQRLVTEGLVARRPGVGFAVAPLTGDDIRDVFLTLGFVSGELAARAVDALTDAQRTELRALHHESIAMLHRDAANGLDSRNRAFYSLINHASRSPKLRWTAGRRIRLRPAHPVLGHPGLAGDHGGRTAEGPRGARCRRRPGRARGDPRLPPPRRRSARGELLGEPARALRGLIPAVQQFCRLSII